MPQEKKEKGGFLHLLISWDKRNTRGQNKTYQHPPLREFIATVSCMQALVTISAAESLHSPHSSSRRKMGGKKFTLEHLQIHKSIPPGHRGVTARCHQHPLHFPLTVSKPHSTAVTHKHPDRLKNNFPGLRSPAAKRLSAVTSLLALLLQQIQIYTSIYFPSKIQAGSLIRKEDWH